jgi:signal transduction histidine kinase
MFRISPPVLFDLGLTPALEWLAEDMQRTYGLTVNVSEPENVPRVSLDDTVRSVLFRCVRELLVNVAKHAKVDAAEVSIFRDADSLAVSVTDAGVGFDPALLAQPGPKERFGLVSVRERIGFVNGTLAIKAIPGDGTVGTLTVPVRKPSVSDPVAE